jgi:hypothetical protein
MDNPTACSHVEMCTNAAPWVRVVDGVADLDGIQVLLRGFFHGGGCGFGSGT